MSNNYHKGDVPTIQGEFTDLETGLPMDPTGVFFQIKTPAGVTTLYEYSVDVEVEKVSTGIYRMKFSASEVGIYYYRVYSIGTGETAFESELTVLSSNF